MHRVCGGYVFWTQVSGLGSRVSGSVKIKLRLEPPANLSPLFSDVEELTNLQDCRFGLAHASPEGRGQEPEIQAAEASAWRRARKKGGERFQRPEIGFFSCRSSHSSYNFPMRKSFWAAITLWLLVQIPYLNTLPNQFLWDDEILIQNNVLIQSWDYLGATFSRGLFEAKGNYYRPLATFSNLIDHSLFGLNSAGFHLTQNLWHATVVLGFFFLLLEFFPATISFCAALLYGLHPVHTAGLMLLSGRCGILEGLWVFALLGLVKGARGSKWGRLGWLTYGLALLSKESAVVFPLLAFSFAWLFTGLERKRALRFAGIYAAMALLYVGARIYWLPFTGGERALSMIAQANFTDRLFTALATLPVYVGLILFPAFLRTERHFVENLISVWPWLGLMMLGFCIWIAWHSRKTRPHISIGLFWFFLFLAPVSNLIPLPVTMSEHWLYLPLMGIFWIGADFLSRIPPAQHKQAGAAIAVLALLYGGRIFMRAYDYRDAFTLFETDLKRSPNSFLLHNNYGVELYRRQRIQEAKDEFLKSVALMPTYGTSLCNLGAIYMGEGNLGKAEQLLRESIQYSKYSLAYKNLFKLLWNSGRGEEAKKILNEAAAYYPFDQEIQAWKSQAK